MIESPVYRPHSESPATAEIISPVARSAAQSAAPARDAWRDLAALRFEVVSRGDIVPGLLYLPEKAPAIGAPLVLIQHGMGDDKTAPYLDFAARWVQGGWAVAMIDLPLHGERSSPKLSERLFSGGDRLIRDQALDPESAALVEEFARQSTSDLARTRAALAARPEIDATRIGFLGFSLGAIVGCYLLGHDKEIRAAVFALSGGGFGPRELDPSNYLSGEFCPDLDLAANRPILIVGAEGDELFSPSSTQGLFESALEPKTLLITKGDHGTLPGKTLGEIHSFLKAAFEA